MSGADPVPSHERVVADRSPAEGPSRWIWFLHGFFGAGRNWRSVARRLVESRPSWGALLVDLRLHGDSRGFRPPHTVDACAADLTRLESAARRPTVVAGHSFGGKVALRYGVGAGERPEEVWVIDSTPGTREPGGSARRMLDAVRELPARFADRDEAVEALSGRGFSRPVARWMATNLERGTAGWIWRFEVEEMESLLSDFFRTELWDAVESPPRGLRVRFVKAEDSSVLPRRECRRIEEAAEGGRVSVHRLPGGHWLNVENPEGLHRLMAEWTDR